jgi:hypothetical protein
MLVKKQFRENTKENLKKCQLQISKEKILIKILILIIKINMIKNIRKKEITFEWNEHYKIYSK